MSPGPRRRAAAILVAAGSGERFGAGLPKAFVELAGVPLLVRAAGSLAACPCIGDIVVVVGPGHEDDARELLEARGLRPRAVCAGGRTRQESVARGLEAMGAGEEIVAVHDAARPLATPDLIARVVAAVSPPVVAAAPGLPVVDTVKRVDEHAVRTVGRDDLWTVQTPQVFDRSTLQRAHDEALARAGTATATPAGTVAGTAAATDDLALVEAVGGHVVLVPGDRRNFKITYPEDLLLAEALVRTEAP